MTARGVAVVGASERNIPWTAWLLTSLARHGYPGEAWLVNPRHEVLHGRRTYPDIAALPASPEVAVLLTGAEQVLVQTERLVEGGCRRIVVVSNGFAELGTPEGRAREDHLRELCAGRDMLLVGPNCVGFASLHERLCAISQPVPHGLEAGDVSIVSQSGGLTAAALAAARHEGLGVDVAFSLGNGAVFGVAEALEYAVARESTRVVLGVVESIRDREGVERAAAAAKAAGKTVALLLLGASEGARGVARSHTGAVVGEQRMLATWLHGLGVVTASSVAQLARVAAVSRVVGAGGGGGGFVATISGGGAGLTADLASRHAVPLAVVAPGTVERLRTALPEGAYVGNPIDISTGDADAVYAALADDPAVRYLVEPWALPWPTESDEYHWQRAAVARLAAMSERTGLPVLVSSIVEQPVSDWMRTFATGTGLEVSSNLELTLAALGRLAGSDRTDGDLTVRGTGSGDTGRGGTSGLVAEATARRILAAAGLPVVAGAEEPDANAVVARARTLTGPFAVKLSLPSVGHKGRVGGVVLGVDGEDALRAACARIRANAVAAGVSDGSDMRYLLTEMVSGPEFLVGVTRDPVAGSALTVAIGGWAAEAGATFGTVALPAGAAALARAVERWNLPHLVGGARAREFAGFLAVLAEAATGELAGFTEIEINPVMLGPRGSVVVDALLAR